MGLKWKLIIGGVLVVLLGVGGYFVGRGSNMSEMNEELRKAKDAVEDLRKKEVVSQKEWENREKNYQNAVKTLNARLLVKKREANVLEERIKESERRLVQAEKDVPSSPDDVCPKFIAAGARSCTRITRPKQ